MRKVKVGDFVKYTWAPVDVIGLYGLVFRICKDSFTPFQVVWIGEKSHWKKYNPADRWRNYDISGVVYQANQKDCKIVSKVPRKILRRTKTALLYVLKHESYNTDKFTNLDLIEVLANVKGLV